MAGNLSRVMACDPSKISIKATTTERLGFEGREEGIVGTLFGLFSKQRISIEEAADEAHMSVEQLKERFAKMSLA